MLFGLLSEVDKSEFLGIATLLSLSDKPLLWDGKGQEKISARTNMENLTIQKGEVESSLLSAWESDMKSVGSIKEMPFNTAFSQMFNSRGDPFDRHSIEKRFAERLKDVPLQKIQDDGSRWGVVSSALRDLLKEKTPSTFYANKVMLFELMLLALADGKISGIEYQFLNEFNHHHKMDGDDFNEILERAESMYRERQKTIALILE